MCQKVLDHLRDNPDCIPYPVAVNLSGHSLEQAGFMPALIALLDGYDIASEDILFEVTETSRIRGLTDVNNGLQMLRKRGHAICLDDFGAGAANFEYLSALDVDIIKFDGSAMRTALANAKGCAFSEGNCPALPGSGNLYDRRDDPRSVQLRARARSGD